MYECTRMSRFSKFRAVSIPLVAQFKTVTPKGERLFVKVDSADATTVGGIVLPASAQKAPTQGEVVAAFKDSRVKVTVDLHCVLFQSLAHRCSCTYVSFQQIFRGCLV